MARPQLHILNERRHKRIPASKANKASKADDVVACLVQTASSLAASLDALVDLRMVIGPWQLPHDAGTGKQKQGALQYDLTSAPEAVKHMTDLVLHRLQTQLGGAKWLFCTGRVMDETTGECLGGAFTSCWWLLRFAWRVAMAEQRCFFTPRASTSRPGSQT